jgi:hypothetical protein
VHRVLEDLKESADLLVVHLESTSVAIRFELTLQQYRIAQQISIATFFRYQFAQFACIIGAIQRGPHATGISLLSLLEDDLTSHSDCGLR